MYSSEGRNDVLRAFNATKRYASNYDEIRKYMMSLGYTVAQINYIIDQMYLGAEIEFRSGVHYFMEVS